MSDRRLRVLSGSGSGADADMSSLIGVLDSARITVRVPDEPTWQQQALLITLVDLLGRLLPRVAVIVDSALPAAPQLPPGPALLRGRVEDARAHGGLTTPEGDATGTTVIVQIGVDDLARPADLHTDGHGWQSYLGTEPSRLTDRAETSTVVGPLAAACRAAAAVMCRVLTTNSTAAAHAILATPPSCYSSALTYDWSPNPLEEPVMTSTAVRALLVGAGSVGGAAVYTLGYTPGIHGDLTVIDPQCLEDHNPDRALLATAAAAVAHRPKVDVAVDTLAHHERLVVIPHQGTVTGYHATLDRSTALPVVLAAVDSAHSRRAIQDCLPLEVINAACHPHEITVSGHCTDDGPCVCCLHMADVLNRDRVTARLIARKTGIPERAVFGLLAGSIPLTDTHIAGIEQNIGLAHGALAGYTGRTLLQLWREQLLYGVTPVTSDTGATVVVAAPYITALAGVLAAGELLKVGNPSAAELRLGPTGHAIVYREDPAAGASYRMLSKPDRWPTSECLCRSARRLRIMRERYGLATNT